ncbi:MAG: histidine--tRNA ligase [Phyllobacteriaceae bacterium]|nr:histidine--tRNA ligase [Phyllobacteriaceae bacterium]
MADKQKKPQKLKARLPRGFVDRSPADIRATDEMVAKIREVYERYGFDPVETPMFEYTDCLGKFLPDSDRPNEGVFSVQDDDEQWMSLRYDLTAPLARHVAENINEIQLPYRTYRAGWVFRNEKPGPGRFRQFMQFDADTVGAPGVQADAEMCMMMADTMEALGLKSQYRIRVNNRKVLDGVMEAIGLGGEENADKRLNVMRSIDKLDKFGVEGVRLLLTTGRWDGGKEGEGDFTPGVGLNDEQIRILAGYQRILSYPWSKPFTIKVYKKYLRIWAKLESLPVLIEDGLDELNTIRNLLREADYPPEKIRIDPSVVRGLEYYTGPVFEAELTFPVTNEKGQEVVFGSVGGGGRYDGLVKRFTGQDVPATGFSIGVSRLMTALKNLGKLGQDEVIAPVLVTVMDKDTEALGNYQKMVQQLRQAGIRAEMYQGNPNKFGKQLQYADRREMPIAVIQGSDERAQGKVQIKDMIEGRRQAAAIESNEEWRETRPGQFEIDETDLVAEVTRLLAEQKAERDG